MGNQVNGIDRADLGALAAALAFICFSDGNIIAGYHSTGITIAVDALQHGAAAAAAVA